MNKINWNEKKWQGKTGSILFEQMCYDVLEIMGFVNLKWRGKTPGDAGRDIECEFVSSEPIVERRSEKWFVECKFSKAGICVSTLEKNIAWCDPNHPDVLLIMTNSTLTNQARNWIDRISTQKRYRISSLEGPKLEQIIEQNQHVLRKYFEYQPDFFTKTLLHLVDSDDKSRKYGLSLFGVSTAQEAILERLDFVMNCDGNARLNAAKSINAIMDKKLYPKDKLINIVKPIYPAELGQDAHFLTEDYVERLNRELRKLRKKLRNKE